MAEQPGILGGKLEEMVLEMKMVMPTGELLCPPPDVADGDIVENGKLRLGPALNALLDVLAWTRIRPLPSRAGLWLAPATITDKRKRPNSKTYIYMSYISMLLRST